MQALQNQKCKNTEKVFEKHVINIYSNQLVRIRDVQKLR